MVVRRYRRSGFDCVVKRLRMALKSQIAILMIANCQAGNILLIEYYFSCDSFDCKLWKNSQFAIKIISQSKPDLRYIDFLILLIHTPLVFALFCRIPTFCSF